MDYTKKICDVDFRRLSRNELYSLCTLTMHAMERLIDRLTLEQQNIYRKHFDYNRLTKEELYQLTTIFVYAMRRLLKRLDTQEVLIRNKKKKS